MKYSIKSISDRFDSGETIKYIFFWGHTPSKGEDVGKFVFSQWFPSLFIVDGVEYKTAEHWMMAGKARLFNDKETEKKIVAAEKPGEVKAFGRQIVGFDESIWNANKYEIVKLGTRYKFEQNEKLKEFLIGTGDRVIVEASPVDFIWGIGLRQDAPRIENPHTWRGENLLGFALMEVRDMLASTY